MKKNSILLILDGYGLNPSSQGNAISQANSPTLDRLFRSYPHTSLNASGKAVGLPEGQMGNSEVGHLNIGAGRVVYQELTRITAAIDDNSFFSNQAIMDALLHAKKNNSSLHLMGLVSDGGVHSHIDHLFALLDFAKKENVKNVYVHAFLDGRDVAPNSGKEYLKKLQDFMTAREYGQIATICGRYYSMDRDQRFERVEAAYDAMTVGSTLLFSSPEEAITVSYSNKILDEFLLPVNIVCDSNNESQDSSSTHINGLISDDDSVIMFNFRPDRAREITRAFVDTNFTGFQRKKVLNNIFYVTMTNYDATIDNVHVAFSPQTFEATLGEHIASLGLNQLRIAETEKYAHVTFFFNGGKEAPNHNEFRLLIPSPKVATYDLKPEMSALEVTEKLLDEINREYYDLIIVNYANADMVGHTGNMKAAMEAIETLDLCLEKVVKAILNVDGQILLTADHGNAECMSDEQGNILTAHTTNPVPLMHISNNPRNFISAGVLSDIAPTLLTLMELPIPKQMSGKSLV